VGFVAHAREISDSGFGSSEWVSALTGELHKFVLAVQIHFLDSPDFALRIAEIGIAVAGIALLAVAVYELAGPRAAVIAAWLLAFEPTSVFFSGILHKESNMFLAEGLVAFGGARMWKRGDLGSLMPIILGCLIGVATRPYAGWFLIAAGAAVTFHAGLRAREDARIQPRALVAIVALFGALSAPIVWEASSDESLEQNVQVSQKANTYDDANLKLERVDFSTREQVFVNLPQRIRDVLVRPYPWQIGNTSQAAGAAGALICLAALLLLARVLVLNRRQVLERAGPLIYLGFFLLIAYALSTGNAGTGFRYRTHLLAIGICVIVVLTIKAREVARSRLMERYAIDSAAVPEPS
jgi:hypothetical protein